MLGKVLISLNLLLRRRLQALTAPHWFAKGLSNKKTGLAPASKDFHVPKDAKTEHAKDVDRWYKSSDDKPRLGTCGILPHILKVRSIGLKGMPQESDATWDLR